ncbi:MAG: PAS domain S-box protein, partial [Bacteroidales bacterium]|nr:PAS domain S-box protein [Bacteroidales bacterium]
MNYREKYLELEEKYTRLEKELKLLKTRKKKSQAPSTKVIEDNKDIGNVLTEIFNTISSYLALFRFGEDGRFYVIDINKKVEEVELTDRNDIVGKCIDDTPFSKRRKLIELLNHVQKFKVAHKIPASDAGDDSEGFYMGFILTSGNIIITWEPGKEQKIADDIYRQSMLFQTFAELLPGIIYEIDLEGRVVYGNKMGLDLFGFSKEDLKKGLFISDVFPEIAANMFMNLQALKSPGEISSNEYFVKRHDGALIPIVTHSFAIFHEGKKIGYRGTVTDVSKHKHIETEIIKQKAFLENLIDSTPEAIVITDPLGKITMVNKEFTNLFGYTYEEAVNEDIDDLIVPERLRDEAFAITNLVSLHQKEVRQTVRKDKSGNELQVSLVATGIIINKETVANIGIYRNITTEKKNQVLQEVLYNISSAALKQMDIKELYPTIVKELSKIWDTNNFFIALYDKKTETLSLPFFSDEKDSFNEIPISKTITGYLIKTNQSVLLKEKDLRLLEESGEIDLVGTDCKVWMGVPLRVENNIIGVMCLQDYNNENKFSRDDLNVLDFIANQIAVAIQRRIMLDNLITARQKAEEAAQS